MDTGWMYEESRRKKYSPALSEKKPKNIKRTYYIVGGVISFIFIVVAIFLFYQSRTIKVADMPALEDCIRTVDGFRNGQLEVIICVRQDGTLILLWENLPEGTRKIDIYRTDEGSGEWGLWRSIPVGGTSGGVEIGIEGPGNFEYYFETLDSGGSTTWISENAPNSPASSENNSAAESPASTSTPISEGSPLTSSTPTPNPQTPPIDEDIDVPSTSTSSAPTPPPSVEEGVYYTPDGQVVSTSTIDLGNFWVQHVDKRIEIGWKNLPDGTDKIVVDRSRTETGGYNQFLEIKNPLGSDSIRLVDNTIHENYYYKMSALDGTLILETYGPMFLP
ncbi:MAG: hypothetical protein Q7R86_01115, partial [bacterium]|nr:hypothetical protein [bacterium]